MASVRRIRTATWWFWLYISLFTAGMLVFRFYSPTAAQYRYSYELSSPPGTLVSDRWNYEFVVDGMFVFVWMIPLSAAFMLCFPGVWWPRTAHLVVVGVLFMWYTVVLFYPGIDDYVNANSTESTRYLNPAHDPRWCCVHFNLAGAPCLNTVACDPAVGADMLVVNPSFLLRFWFNVALLLLIIFDFFYTILVFNRAVDDYQKERERDALPETRSAGEARRARRRRKLGV